MIGTDAIEHIQAVTEYVLTQDILASERAKLLAVLSAIYQEPETSWVIVKKPLGIGWLNIRTATSTSAAIIARAYHNYQLEIASRVTVSGWPELWGNVIQVIDTNENSIMLNGWVYLNQTILEN